MAQPTTIPKPWFKVKKTKKVVPKRGCKNVKIAAAYGRRPLTRAAATRNIARTIAAKTNVKLRTRIDKKLTKLKKAVMVEDDGPDEGYNDSNGGDLWHSEEMKTPLKSEDELEKVDSDDVFLAFRKGGRFGELRLEVGMTFTTKMEFKEAVREYCIQEGRMIWFKKNDNVKMKAVCKDESCGWLVYASNNTENNHWQIKTFMDDYTCARETKNSQLIGSG
ncbi:hypothetical protein Ahy_A03g014070 [Arachis hypogaea]|uniref:Transposase MuDR plant domain-containing protein n=1 Tax=Arachis hypogaea TaxID=3818 RepID=A0A445DWV9_ARAHY|nr:hypothetical protein Ahy_A03g014070 [Arachis hypogaea]